MSTLNELTGWELRAALAEKQISARELTEAVFQRIDQVEASVHAYRLLDREAALAQADAVDERIAAGDDVGSLAGLPIAVKDNLCTQGKSTTCCSKILEDFVPPYDATVVQQIQAAGAVIVGKTNMDEFAMGSSTENSAFGPTRNPWDVERVPGGSSGGSAAAVAADETVLAFGSDTGGSIRQPAALCGVVGLKPTYGRVSRYGLVAFASSLDQIGPITKDVKDAALMMNVIGRHDPMDSTSLAMPTPDYVGSLGAGVKGWKIGLPKEYFAEGIDPAVAAAVRQAADVLVGQGAEVREVSLPHTEYAVATYYLVATAEASSNLARYDGVHYGHRTAVGADEMIELYSRSRQEGFGAEVKRRIMLGTYALSSGYYDAYYLKASKMRTLFRRDFDQAFEQVDVILSPTAPTPAFRIGEKTDDPLTMYLSDVYTISANLAGIPAISLPCGFTDQGLPIGLQVLGPTLGDEAVLQAAYAFEQATDHHRRKPEVPHGV